MIARFFCTACLAGCLSPALAARLKIENGVLTDGGRRFVIRGVAYSNVSIGEQPSASLGRPCLLVRDLPLIAAMGANTIRTRRLLPQGDDTLVSLLDTTRLYWLADFPLDAFHDPAKPITALREPILRAFREYALRFRGRPRLIGYVFGNEVARDYHRKFAGAASDFYPLLASAAAILHELEPEAPPLLTTAVSEPSELALSPAGLDFWAWNAYPGSGFSGLLEEARKTATRPVLISEYGVDAWDQAAGQENEQAQARAAAGLTREIESAGWLLGAVYAAFVDEWWRGGADPTQHLAGGAAHPGFPDGFRNDAWFGIFRAIATEQPGFDSLQPRAVYRTLAALWGGTLPLAWSAQENPRLETADNAASGDDSASPGSLLRLSGKALVHSPTPYAAEDWPLHLDTTCLCLGAAPARLGFLAQDRVSAQVPWSAEPGEWKAVFFQAGRASNALPIRVRRFAPGIFPNGVLRGGSDCQLSAENGTRPGEVLEVYATGLGAEPPASLEAFVNQTPARVLYAGLAGSGAGINQVNVQVGSETPPSASSALQLRIEGFDSNPYPLAVAGPEDAPAIVLRPSRRDLVLQAGGPPCTVDIGVAGASGYCGTVLFEALRPLPGISYQIPVAFTGRRVLLQVRAATDTQPVRNGVFTLSGFGGGARAAGLSFDLTVLPRQGQIPVRVVSGGYPAGPVARLDWNGYTIFATAGGGPGRGINVAAIEPQSGILSPVRTFDTWADEQASAALLEFLAVLPLGTIVLFAVADEGSYRLTPGTRGAIAAWFGSRFIQALGYQYSWAMIGRKGARGPMAEETAAGARVVLEQVLTLPQPS